MKKISIYLVFLSILSLYACSNTKENEQKNLELEKIENDIYILINEGKQKEALNLVGKLSHPSTDEWEQKEKKTEVFGVEMFNGYFTYKEWWDDRREVLREEIMNMNSTNTKEAESLNSNLNNGHTLNNNSKNNLVDDIYLGLYVADRSDDKTQFYKFIQKSEGGFEILYQDNLSGELIMEKFLIIKFNQQSGKVLLENISESNDKRILFFRKNPSSENGFKLIDEYGIVFRFISN